MIKCRFCNKDFISLIDSYRHICNGKKTKWKSQIGRNSALHNLHSDVVCCTNCTMGKGLKTDVFADFLRKNGKS